MEYIKLSEICESISDGDHLAPPKSECGVPFVTISDIRGNDLDFSDTMFVPESYYDKLDSKRKARKDDILYTVVGSFGIPVFIKQDKKFSFQRHIAILRPNKNVVEPKFLYYTMKSPEFYAQADSFAIGAAQRTISLSSLRRMRIKLPSLETQNNISSVLSLFDEHIENNQKRIKLLEQMAENLYKEWFVRFRFPGYETAEFEGGVPKGWNVVKVKECVDRLRFGTLYGKDSVESEGDVIVIDQSQEPYIGFHNNAPSHIADTQKPIILFGDHSCKFELMIIPFSLAENVVPFVAKTGIYTTFLFFTTHNLIQTTEYKRHWTEFVNKKILLPPANLQREYAKRVIDMLSMKQQLIIENRLLSKQRDLLLPRLMSGKLSI